MKALYLIFILSLVGCASPHPLTKTAGSVSDAEYESMFKHNTYKTNQYDGFYQTFQADATFLSTELRTAGVARQADFQQWDSSRLQKERDNAFQQMATQTEFFLRFFTPDNDNDDLGTGKSMWKIYLDVAGKRFEGDVKKLSLKLAELRNLYPTFDRFSTPYVVSFKIPTAATETGPAKLVITSIMGTAEFNLNTTK